MLIKEDGSRQSNKAYPDALVYQDSAELYLKPLDEAFSKCEGLFYLRYNDDIIILTILKASLFAQKRD